MQESLHTLSAYLSNAERRYTEDKPRKWWVMIEFLIMGIIGGYYIPMWIAMAAYPHERGTIDNIMGGHFSGNLNNLLTDDVFMVSYDYQS